MSEEVDDERLDESIKRILILQVVFAGAALAIVAGFFFLKGLNDARFHNQAQIVDYLKAISFGSVLGIGNTILSARSVKRSSRAVLATPSLAMLPVYAGLLNKLVLIGGGIAFGLIVFDLNPLFVFVGYFVVQIAFVIAN